MNFSLPRPQSIKAWRLAWCLIAAVTQTSFAHRIMEYERWPLEKLRKEAMEADLGKREIYIQELGKRFRQDDKTVSTLLAIIQNPREDYLVRTAACASLDLSSSKSAGNIEVLTSLVRSDEDQHLRLEALWALTEQCRGKRQVIELCFETAKDKSNSSIIRRNAVHEIGEHFMNVPESHGILMAYLADRDEDPHVRYNAAAGLIKHDLNADGVLPLLKSILLDKSEEAFIRSKIVWCLGKLSKHAPIACDVLYQVASDEAESQVLRDEAIGMLVTEFEDIKRGLPLALEMVPDASRAWGPRLSVISFLSEKRRSFEKTLYPMCLEIAKNRNDHKWVRVAAIKSIHYGTGLEEAYPHLKAISMDAEDHPDPRLAALEKICSSATRTQDVTSIIKAIVMNPGDNIDIRSYALYQLYFKFSDEPDIPTLLSKLAYNPKDEEKIRIQSVSHLLYRYPQEISTAQLEKWARSDAHGSIRRKALETLSKPLIKDQNALWILLRETDSIHRYIDPGTPITCKRVTRVSEVLNWPEAQVVKSYEELSEKLPLQLEWKK